MPDLTCPACSVFDDKEVQCKVIEELPESYPFGSVIAECPECKQKWVV